MNVKLNLAYVRPLLCLNTVTSKVALKLLNCKRALRLLKHIHFAIFSKPFCCIIFYTPPENIGNELARCLMRTIFLVYINTEILWSSNSNTDTLYIIYLELSCN